nr:hypothetical protein [Tanacetum cinerariifolium]
MCMCLKDHLDAKERKQDKCPLEIPLDFEEDVFDDEVQRNEAIPLSDEKIALDASREGTQFPGGPRSFEKTGKLTFVDFSCAKRLRLTVHRASYGEAMINSIKNGDQPLPRVTQVSIAGTSSAEQPLLKDKSMCNKTAKDLWDALARHMLGFEYIEQDRKAAVLYEYETFKATEGELLLDTYIRYLQKTKVSKSKEKVVVSSDSKGSDADDVSELKNITDLLAKDFNRRKFYSKPTNNNLRTASTSQFADKKQEFVKTNDKKVEKKDDEKKQDMSKVKLYNCKKEGHFEKDCKKVKVKDYEYYKTKMLLAKQDKDEQVLLAEDQAWMESSSDSDQEINANMIFMAQIKKVLLDLKASSSSADDKISEVSYYLSDSESKFEYETLEYYDKTTTYGLFVNDNDDQEIFHDCENFPENLIESQIDHNESAVDHNDSEGIDNYFEKAKDLRPSLYDEKVIGLGYTPMFLTHSDEALEIEKFKSTRENKIEFAYDYGSLNASHQTSSLKPYVPTVILEKIIIDLEDEVVILLEKEKENLKTIESLKSKDVETGVESSEKVIFETENKSENDCQVIEKVCDSKENPKVIAPKMFKLNLDTLSSVRRPKPSGVMWMRKGLSNTIKVDLSSVNHSNLNKNVKRYPRKNLMACNNFDTCSTFDCNNARNALCNARMNASVDVNDLFVFDDVSIRKSHVSKMPFRKKPRDSLNVRSKSNSN